MGRKLLRNFIEKYMENHESFTTDNIMQAYNDKYHSGTTQASVIYILNGLKRVGKLKLKNSKPNEWIVVNQTSKYGD